MLQIRQIVAAVHVVVELYPGGVLLSVYVQVLAEMTVQQMTRVGLQSRGEADILDRVTVSLIQNDDLRVKTNVGNIALTNMARL